MSLIHQALERAQADTLQSSDEVRLSALLEKEERKQLETLEKKIDEIKKQAKVSHWASWVVGLVCIIATMAGILGVYYSIQKQSEENIVTRKFFDPAPLASVPVGPAIRLGGDTELALSGITISGGVRYALINNQVVAVGDMLKKENVLVKEIQPRSVIIERNGRPLTLSLDSKV